MPQKVRIALDAMGGDVGASVVIPGAAISLTRHPHSEYLLFGDRALIEPQLAKHPALKATSRIIHTDIAVSMHDKPSQALRRGRNKSSMWLAIDPYPRKPGAVFEPRVEADDPEDHPFAALKALKPDAKSQDTNKPKRR